MGPPMMGPPMGPGGVDASSCAPPCPPPTCGPPLSCAPPACGPQECQFTWELGSRLMYFNNAFKVSFSDSRQNIDFVRDLNFSPSFLTGEVYGALRVAPRFVLTYTFMIPRSDGGWGVLPSTLNFNGTTILAGSTTNWKVTPYVIRQEAEYYCFTGCNYRVGPVLAGEVIVSDIKVDYLDPQGLAHHRKTTSVVGWPSIGGIGEFAPTNGAFLRFKGLYHFIPSKLSGFTLEGDMRFFPDLGSSCDGAPPSQVRPYLGVGYRYTNIWANISDNEDITHSFYGPFGEFGVIF